MASAAHDGAGIFAFDWLKDQVSEPPDSQQRLAFCASQVLTQSGSSNLLLVVVVAEPSSTTSLQSRARDFESLRHWAESWFGFISVHTQSFSLYAGMRMVGVWKEITVGRLLVSPRKRQDCNNRRRVICRYSVRHFVEQHAISYAFHFSCVLMCCALVKQATVPDSKSFSCTPVC